MPSPSTSASDAASMHSSRSRPFSGSRLPTHQPDMTWVWMCTQSYMSREGGDGTGMTCAPRARGTSRRASGWNKRLHGKLTPVARPDEELLVEILVRRWTLEMLRGGEDRDFPHPSLARALLVARDGFARRHLEEVQRRPKLRGARQPDVAGAFLARRVGVVDHDRLLRRQAREQHDLLALARLEHVERHADVGVQEAPRVKRRLAGGGDAGEDDQFHAGTVARHPPPNIDLRRPNSPRDGSDDVA